MTAIEHVPAEVVALPTRTSPSELAAQASEVREMMKAVLVEDVDYGRIPGTPKPTLFKSGAEWLLRWARFGHRLEKVEVERDQDGQRYGVTYRAVIHALSDPSTVVATCDGYCGYDEPDREEHTNKWGKTVGRSPWNTIIKMAQKRALVGATLQATATSGLFTQDVEDQPSAGESSKADRPQQGAVVFGNCDVCKGRTKNQVDGKYRHDHCKPKVTAEETGEKVDVEHPPPLGDNVDTTPTPYPDPADRPF